MAKEQAFNGTMLKYLLEITASGFDMDRDDFEVAQNGGTVTISGTSNSSKLTFTLTGTNAIGLNGSWVEASDVLVKDNGTWK